MRYCYGAAPQHQRVALSLPSALVIKILVMGEFNFIQARETRGVHGRFALNARAIMNATLCIVYSDQATMESIIVIDPGVHQRVNAPLFALR